MDIVSFKKNTKKGTLIEMTNFAKLDSVNVNQCMDVTNGDRCKREGQFQLDQMRLCEEHLKKTSDSIKNGLILIRKTFQYDPTPRLLARIVHLEKILAQYSNDFEPDFEPPDSDQFTQINLRREGIMKMKMNRQKITAEELESLLISYCQLEVTRYSGRFMYNKECPAVIVDSVTVFVTELMDGFYHKLNNNQSPDAILQALTVEPTISDQKKAEIALYIEDTQLVQKDISNLKDALRGLEIDSLGLGYVVYFPKYTY